VDRQMARYQKRWDRNKVPNIVRAIPTRRSSQLQFTELLLQ
jgi:hypothetical protein